MAGERNSRSRRTNTSPVPVRQDASVQRKVTPRATGGHSVSDLAVSQPVRDLVSFNQNLEAFFKPVQRTLMDLYKEDVKDEIAHERAVNADQRIDANVDAAKGIRNEELYKTDWDYRLTHKAATTGKEIADIRREEGQQRVSAERQARAAHQAALEGDTGWQSVGSNKHATAQNDAAVWAVNFLNDGRYQKLGSELDKIILDAKSSEDARAKLNTAVETYADEVIKNQGITGPHADLIRKAIIRAAKKVGSQTLGRYEKRARAQHRAEAKASHAARLSTSIVAASNGDTDLRTVIQNEMARPGMADKPHLAKANVLKAMTHMVKTGALGAKGVMKMRDTFRNDKNPVVRAAYANLLDAAIGRKGKVSAKQDNEYTKLRNRAVDLRHKIVTGGTSRETQAALAQYKKQLDQARQDGTIHERHYGNLQSGLTSLMSGLQKQIKLGNAGVKAIDAGGIGLRKARPEVLEATYQKLKEQQQQEVGGTAVRADGHIDAAGEDDITRTMAQAGGIRPATAKGLINTLEGGLSNPEAAQAAAVKISNLMAIKDGALDWQFKSVKPLMDKIARLGGLRATPEGFKSIMQDHKDDNKITDAYMYFFGTKKPGTGTGGEHGAIKSAIVSALGDLEGEGEVRLYGSQDVLRKRLVEFARANGIARDGGQKAITQTIQRMINTGNAYYTYTFEGGVKRRNLILGKDPSVVGMANPINDSTAPRAAADMAVLRTRLNQKFLDSKGRVAKVAFGGETAALGEQPLTLVPQGKFYLVSAYGNVPVRIAPGRIVGTTTGLQPGQANPVFTEKQSKFELMDSGEREMARRKASKALENWKAALDRSVRTGRNHNPGGVIAGMVPGGGGLPGAGKLFDRVKWLKDNPRPWHPTKNPHGTQQDHVPIRDRKPVRVPVGLSRGDTKTWLNKNMPLPNRYSWKVEMNSSGRVSHASIAYVPGGQETELDRKVRGSTQ